LFSKITGPLSAAGINILSAQIFTRQDGIAIDTFFVNSGSGAALVSREERERFEDLLFQTLSGNVPDIHALLRQRPPGRRLYQSLEGEEIPTHIQFDNEASSAWTVIEIETEDRIGLLFTISEVLFEVHLDVALAKIITEKGAAIDAFYVSEHDGQKILSLARQKFVGERLRAAIASLKR
jgi:[protein-PII] uridylyltransferase